MNAVTRTIKNTGIVRIIAFIFLLAIHSAAQAKDKLYTIGLVMDDTSFSQELNGFKTSMAEKGYMEERDIRYISYGFIDNESKDIDIEKRHLLNKDVDMIVAMGNNSALWAKNLAQGTDIKVLFCMISSDPVADGMVKTLSRPGGNVTGIQVANSIPKSLEWLKRIAPQTEKIYLPYNPSDEISVLALKGLDKTAVLLGIKLVVHRISSVEEVLTAIENMPQDIDAVFWIPSLTLDPSNNKLSSAAISRKLPTGSALPLDESVLVTFSPDSFQAGRQTARMAHQILNGIKPADIPVEKSEIMLVINLRTAEKIGIHISDNILAQANKIIR